MSKALLAAGGILNLIFGLFHILLGYRIAQWQQLPPGARSLMLALNVGGTLFIFFFAYASFFQREDVLGTRLGRSVLAVASLLYLSRAAEEFILFSFSPAIFFPCLLVGLLYAVLVYLAKPGERRPLVRTAAGAGS